MTDRIESVEELQRRLSGLQVAMVATQDEHGTISSRPVTLQDVDKRGDLWFLVDRHAAWVAPADGRAVNASIIDGKKMWLSFAGRLELGDGPRTDELRDGMSDTFFAGDAEPVAARIAVNTIEWWTAPNAAVQFLDLARARLTDQPPAAGESGSLRAGSESES